MASFNNTFVYAEEWAVKMQERLSEPTKWKEVCQVEYTNFRLLNNPYLTDPTVQSLTRGSSYTMQEIKDTNETVTISTGKILPQFIDRADLAQSQYPRQMELADRQAVLINESIEQAWLNDYASMTAFDNSALPGGSAGSITVSATNVDDIIRSVKRKIRVAGGESLANRNGTFIVWRPADFEILEQFMQANGFTWADRALTTGTSQGMDYMGITHYSSNLLSGGNLVAGVKKTYHIGILKDTYGQVMVDEKDPGQTSGISVVSRVDFGLKVWTKLKPVLFNIQAL